MDSPTPSPVPQQPRASGSFLLEVGEFIWETVKVVLISLIIILPVRYFLIQPFFVKGASMVPTFQDKEYILVDKWTYRLSRPHRGDVVIFKYPADPSQFFIKRIAALPGETISVGNNSILIFNKEYPEGFVLNERGYLPTNHQTVCGSNSTFCGRKVELKDNEYFLIGDNREHSSDSRFFGPVAAKYFSGMAWLRLWPLTRVGFLERTTYPPVIR